MRHGDCVRPWTILTVLALVLLALAPSGGRAASTAEFLATLSADEAQAFLDHRQARRAHNERLDAYWERVEAKRSGRKAKRRAGIRTFSTDDYVMQFPPVYDGPKLSPGLAARYAKFLEEQAAAAPEKPRKEIPTVEDFLASAASVYGFRPERVSEATFKRRYAEEALALGLSKDQVVRVYALETGGNGTYDMQAGIHPIKKTGRAISTALGYAQLLDANSVNEVSANGHWLIERLEEKASAPGLTDERRASLRGKIKVVKAMRAKAKAVPFDWSKHQAFAKVPAGQGMHALNLDGDIGPMLQAIKLRTVSDYAIKAGRLDLTGAELEIMNLSGPATGLEMMQDAGSKAPTANFFARKAYYVNKMVIGLTGAQLLAELDRRMDNSVKLPGAIEFAAAFDSVRTASTESLPWRQ